jgi:hypothetical protein
VIIHRQIADQVPERLKRGFFEENEEISWDNFSRMGNGILIGVVWEWEMGNRK